MLPRFAADAERFLNAGPLSWPDLSRPLPAGHELARFSHLMRRIETRQIDRLIAANREVQPQAAGQISIDQFAAVDLRVARVISAEEVEGSDKLIRVAVDLGELGRRTILAGLRGRLDVASLPGTSVVICANLKPRKMRFGTSEGMILAAAGDEGPVILQPAGPAAAGAAIN